MPSVPSCKTCNKTTGEMPLKDKFCFIGGACYHEHAPKESKELESLDSQCNTCQPSKATGIWSPLPNSTLCDDKQANTHSDRCVTKGQEATCEGTKYKCELECQVSMV